jgi:hypothetical protein
MIDFTKIEYRFLTVNDKDNYLDSLSKVKKFMGEGSEESLYEVTRISNNLGKEGYKIYAAFYQGKIISSQMIFFPLENINIYYAGLLVSTINESSLIKHKVSHYIFGQMLNGITSYAEERGYFAFYSKRTIRDQMLIDKIYNKFVSDNVFFGRYEALWDKIYHCPCPCNNLLHSHFKKNIENFSSDSVVILNVLKQEHRKEILKKHSNSFSL